MSTVNSKGEVYKPWKCGMCDEEFLVMVTNGVVPDDTACVNCGSDETEADCDHDDAEVCPSGNATCNMCGHRWFMTDAELERHWKRVREGQYWDRVDEGRQRAKDGEGR